MEYRKHTGKSSTWLLLSALFVLGAAAITWYVIQNTRYPSTDDAYLQAHVVNIAPQVSGPVVDIYVKDHQPVTQGQPLFSIDSKPYQFTVERTDAELQLAIEQGQRLFPLIKQGKVAPAEGDKIRAQIEEAKSDLAQARYNLERTVVKAPAAGIVANFTTRIGDTVNQGINLFAIVEQNDFWVNANFKETQLERIKIGQTADIKIDMYPNDKLKGVVQSMSPGSGTIFSLLPPENATGNWVKVTQRVPVKIKITTYNPNIPLIAGTSAHVTVDTVTRKP